MKMFQVILIALVMSAGQSAADAQAKKPTQTYQVRVIVPAEGAPTGPSLAPVLTPINAAWILVIDSKGDDLEVVETDPKGFTKVPQLVGRSWLIVTAPGFEPILVMVENPKTPLLIQMKKVK